MAIRQFRGNQHILRLSDFSIITYEYVLLDIDVAIIECAFGFWMERKSIIEFPTSHGDDHE